MVERFTSEDLPYIKCHALRALCGLLMNRHSACAYCPFCGDSDREIDLIVDAVRNVTPDSDMVVSLYFSETLFMPSHGGLQGVVNDWGKGVRYGSAEPGLKAVVRLLTSGKYLVNFGKVAGTTPGDYSSGYLDTQGWEAEYICDPEPDWTQWQYWDSNITEKQVTVPQFLCKRLQGEWWILDRDLEQRLIQQVAGLRVADCPGHLEFGTLA